ncbi:helix-turn-helix transcriptional regulator [Acetobacter persici]|nr:helix-turn-helix transcriptional regulator [Acetobacter persici]
MNTPHYSNFYPACSCTTPRGLPPRSPLPDRQVRVTIPAQSGAQTTRQHPCVLVILRQQAHLAEPFDLDVLAALCDMSRFHFSRSFHNTMGQSPSRWFIQARMKQASHLLLHTDLPVIEVALTVGYKSPSHFAQIFRKTTGVSPRSYRAL